LTTWEKIRIILPSISAILISVMGVWVGNNYTRAIKEREIQGKFVEIAVDILREPPQKEKWDLRTWATEIINRYSGVQLSESTKTDLIEKIPLTVGVRTFCGRVADQSGTPIADAKIYVKTGEGIMFSCLTDAFGTFCFHITMADPDRIVKINVTKEGFYAYESELVLSQVAKQSIVMMKKITH